MCYNSARVIIGDSYNVRSKQILIKLGRKNLNDRRNSQITSYVAKAPRKKGPENICNMFKILHNENCNLTNNNLMLMLSKPRSKAMKRAFSYEDAKIWKNQSIENKRIILNSLIT